MSLELQPGLPIMRSAYPVPLSPRVLYGDFAAALVPLRGEAAHRFDARFDTLRGRSQRRGPTSPSVWNRFWIDGDVEPAAPPCGATQIGPERCEADHRGGSLPPSVRDSSWLDGGTVSLCRGAAKGVESQRLVARRRATHIAEARVLPRCRDRDSSCLDSGVEPQPRPRCSTLGMALPSSPRHITEAGSSRRRSATYRVVVRRRHGAISSTAALIDATQDSATHRCANHRGDVPSSPQVLHGGFAAAMVPRPCWACPRYVSRRYASPRIATHITEATTFVAVGNQRCSSNAPRGDTGRRGALPSSGSQRRGRSP